MTDSKNAQLDLILQALRAIKRAEDMRFLRERVRSLLDKNYIPKMYGFPGGYARYSFPLAFQLADLDADDLATLKIVVEHLYTLLSPLTVSRGVVQLKTMKRRYADIDFETGLPVIDQNGQIVGQDFYYTYVYVRRYAGRGDAAHKRAKWLSIYADRGMGRGGSGGWVAAALHEGVVSEDDVLDAWHAGRDFYERFIDDCQQQLEALRESQKSSPPQKTLPDLTLSGEARQQAA